MSTLVAAPPPVVPRPDLEALAAAVRRVIGADEVVVLRREGDVVRIAGAFALRPSVAARLEGAPADEVTGTLEREYGATTAAQAVFDGEVLGSVHAVREAAEPFEDTELLAVFASQVGLVLALAQHPRAAPPAALMTAELDDLVLRVDDLEALCNALQGVIAPLFGGARAGVMVAYGHASALQQLPGSFGAEGELTASHRVSAFDLFSNSARVFTTGQPYVSNCCAGDPAIRQGYVAALGLRSLLTVPLGDVGVLHIADGDGPFTLSDVARALALAPRIGWIISLATTLVRLRRQQRLEEVLADVATNVASGAATGEFVAPTLQKLCEATDAHLVAIVADEGPPTIARAGAGHAAREQAVLEEADSEPGMRAYVVGPESPGDPGWAAFYVPIRLRHQRIGTLAAFRNRGEPFLESERRSFVRAANLAALAQASERYQQQRAELARAHERQRIADDLHDDVAQILFASQLSLDAILQRSDTLDEDVVAAIKRSRGLLIRGDTAIRTVIHRLSGPPVADIGTRLGFIVAGVEDEFSLPIRLQVEQAAVHAASRLSDPVVEGLVKVARESLVNAAKHAGDCRATLALRLAGRGVLELVVADDGRGVQPDEHQGEHGHGLWALSRSMRDLDISLERGERPGGGTRIIATVRLPGAP